MKKAGYNAELMEMQDTVTSPTTSAATSPVTPCGKSRTRAGRSDLVSAPEPDTELETFLCPVDEAARIVGQKWTLQIVHHLLDGHSQRFCELQEALGKVNPSTLSSRLKMLEEAGLVTRSQISDIPPHVEYRLTAMGAELRGVINEITRWSNTHLCGIHPTRQKSASVAAPGAASVASSAAAPAARSIHGVPTTKPETQAETVTAPIP
ncbi:MAG: helix-turn-helix domain-containing protein [Litorilinea sp.]